MEKGPLWYVLYTKPRWEKKVADQLAHKGVEHYYPLNRIVRLWSGSKKLIWESLFKSYVFVRIQEDELLKVKETSGVLNLVYWLGKPAVIREEEIDTMKAFLNDHQNVQLEKTGVSIHDCVTTVEGPFMYRQGDVIGVTHELVKVQLPSLGYALVAQIARKSGKVVSMNPNLPKEPQLIAK